jgi:tetratricopeptide (TPR) repeat protein
MDAGHWSAAAHCFAQLADGATTDTARAQALLWAGDCLRRDERPATAARLLRDAHALADGPLEVAILTQLAGVLHPVGELAVARDLAREAAARASPELRPAALDTWLTAATALGALDEVDACLDALRSTGAASVPLHEAAALRRLGRCDEAIARLEDVVAAHPEQPLAVAMARGAQGEAGLFAAQPEEAAARYAESAALWRSAGRRSGAFRGEAGQLRATLQGEELILPSVLDAGIAYAAERQQCLLEAHLRIIRAGARWRAGLSGAADDIVVATEIAAAAGARFLEGRARLGGAALGRPVDAARLAGCIAGDAGWQAVAEGRLPALW